MCSCLHSVVVIVVLPKHIVYDFRWPILLYIQCMYLCFIGASLLIFANKQDLGGALSLEDIALALDLDGADISGRHWQIFACSGMTGEGLAKGFTWIVEDISSRVFIMS